MAALDSWLPEYRTCGGKERDEENDGGEKTVNDRGEYKRERERAVIARICLQLM
jgi:hypothetical protein